MSQESILFEKAIGNVNSILKLTGMHLIIENNDKSFIARLRRRRFFCFFYIWFNQDVASETAWFVHGLITGRTLVELTYVAPAIATCYLADVKGYFFMKNEPYVNDLVSSLRKLQSITVSGKIRNEVEKELKRRMSFLMKATNIQFWLNVMSLAGFAILPFILMGMTYSETGKIELMLPYVLLYPFDVYDKRIWPFLYLHEIWSSHIVVFTVFGPDSLYYTCCTFIQIQFRYLHYDLERIISGNTSQHSTYNFRAEFAACVKRHKELIRCVSLMELTYSKSTLFNVVSSSMLICLTGFNITAMSSWPMMMPFIAFVFLVSGQIFLFCYFGDMIMRSSSAISDAAYNCQWYNADGQAKKDLLFVLTRAQKPCKLTAYGFSDINLKTFTRILSTAWSYFALLSTVNGSNISNK